MPGVGSTGLSRAIDADYDREGDDLYLQNPSKNYLSSIDLSKYDPAPPYDDSNFPGIENRDMQKYLEDETNFNNQGIRSIDTIANKYTPGKWKGSEIDINEDVLDINKVGPRITQIGGAGGGGEGLSIPKEWLEVPIKTLERTIQNLQTGVDNANALGMEGSEDNEKNKEKLEQLKKVIEFKKKQGETAEGLLT